MLCLLTVPRYFFTSLLFFFFNDTATTEIYTLSLHDALPIYPHPRGGVLLSPRPPPDADVGEDGGEAGRQHHRHALQVAARRRRLRLVRCGGGVPQGRAADRPILRFPLQSPRGQRAYPHAPPWVA